MSSRISSVALVAVSGLVGGVAALALAPTVSTASQPSQVPAAPGKTYTLCVSKKSKQVFQRSWCKSGERTLTVSSSGTAGPAGPQGPQGPQGVAGVNCPNLSTVYAPKNGSIWSPTDSWQALTVATPSGGSATVYTPTTLPTSTTVCTR